MTIFYQITLGCSNIFIYLQSRFTALCFMTWLKMHFTYGYSRSLLIDTYSFYATICLRLTNCFVNNLTVMVLFIIKSFPDCYRCPTVSIAYLKVLLHIFVKVLRSVKLPSHSLPGIQIGYFKTHIF